MFQSPNLTQKIYSSVKHFSTNRSDEFASSILQRAQTQNIHNLKAEVANVYHLPFEDGTFDAIYMITVISEIPEPERAMQEFYRVLSPTGTLAFSELLTDPDYPLARTLARWASKANFRLKNKLGNFFSYTLVFEKQQG